MRLYRASIAAAFIALAGLAVAATAPSRAAQDAAAPASQTKAVATFAAGCFWCVQADFDKLPGVVETLNGYTGGMTLNPTYDDVSTGRTGHTEAVQVTYDPARLPYEKLLDYYWHHVDLVDGRGQFCDRGNQYRPAIFVHTPQQKKIAEESKTALDASGRFTRKIAVQIVDAGRFVAAEEQHQNYYKTHPYRYKFYRAGCGRDARIEQLWGSDAHAGH
jgi:methionine-S-sulfoxide reductase